MKKTERLALAIMVFVLAALSLAFPDYAKSALAMLLGAASFLVARKMSSILVGDEDAK